MDRAKPLLSDEAVEALPLHHGRTELLEEIMNTPVVERPVVLSSERRSSRYLAPLVAAVAVAALAGGTLWWSSQPPPETGFAAAPGVSPEGPPAYLPLLEAPGWVLENVGPGEDGGSARYMKGDVELEISWREAELYDDYVDDRENIVDPPAPGRPVEVIGRSGQLWSYTAKDHTTISVVEDDLYYELRADGLRRSAYLDLIAQVRLVDLAELEMVMPDELITTQERPSAVDDVVDGIAAALAPEHGLVPRGAPAHDFDTRATDRYYLGVDLAGPVACGWLEHYVAARSAGDDLGMKEAVGAMATAREWPILREMDVEGDYPEVLWEYADLIAAGRNPLGFESGLGCS